MSLRDEVAGPFRGSGEAGRALLAGSRVLAGHVGRGLRWVLRAAWRAASKGESAGGRVDAAGNAVLAGLIGLAVAGTVGGALAYLVRPYVRWVAAGLAVAWVVAAWAVAPLQGQDTTPNDHETLAGEQHPQPDPHHGAREIVRTVITAVANAKRDGYKGVHLVELLDQLRADGLTQANEVSQFRAWLEAAGIPTNRNLKRDGKGPTWGVRADELAEALGRPLRDALTALDQTPVGTAAEPPIPAAEEAPTATPPEAQEQPPAGRHLAPVPTPSPEAAA